jgi:hypothetical protein
VIQKAVLEACDAKDGVKDGVLEDPTRGKFDPEVIQCKGGDAADAGDKVERTRPLCPYSKVAVYKGSGSTDEAWANTSNTAWRFAMLSYSA